MKPLDETIKALYVLRVRAMLSFHPNPTIHFNTVLPLMLMKTGSSCVNSRQKNRIGFM